LISFWLDADMQGLARFRIQPPWRGCLDSRPLHALLQRLHDAFKPQTGIAVLATEIPRLHPRIFQNEAITWKHLAASSAVFLGYEQIRIDGKMYTDGGLLGVLPLWVAEELGATRVVAVNVMPAAPSATLRALMGVVRRVAPVRSAKPGRSLEVRMIAPPGPLGPLRDAVFWNRASVEDWIARGESDARRVDLEWT
jgi:predicted acylesterase/phospholipase RssA